MKYAYPIGTPETWGKLLAYQGDFENGLSNLREAGYEGVELFIRYPDALDYISMIKLLKKYNLEVPVIGTGPIVSNDGLTFTSLDSEKRIESIQRIKKVIDFASTLNAQVNIGKLRGTIHPDCSSESLEWMSNAFYVVCAYGSLKNVPIIVECQNHTVINNLNTTTEILDYIKHFNNLYLMHDTYHLHVQGESIHKGFIEGASVLTHVHFSDSNRLIPGEGDIDFEEAISTLNEINYKGFVTIEVNQQNDSIATANKCINYLRQLEEN